MKVLYFITNGFIGPNSAQEILIPMSSFMTQVVATCTSLPLPCACVLGMRPGHASWACVLEMRPACS